MIADHALGHSPRMCVWGCSFAQSFIPPAPMVYHSLCVYQLLLHYLFKKAIPFSLLSLLSLSPTPTHHVHTQTHAHIHKHSSPCVCTKTEQFIQMFMPKRNLFVHALVPFVAHINY